MRTRETIEASQSGKTPNLKAELPRKRGHNGNPNSLKNLVAPWTSETAPRTCGRPKMDVAQRIARAVFENNEELLYKAYSMALAKGQAFAFQVLSDRAYGKLKESLEVSGTDEIAAMLESARKRTKK